MTNPASSTAVKYRRRAAVAVLVWFVMCCLLFFLLPIPPRLRLTAPDGQRVLGIASDGQTLISARATDAWSGPIRRRNLKTGHQEVFEIRARQTGVTPPGQPGTPSRAEDTGLLIRNPALAPGGQSLAYQHDNDGGDFSLRLLNLMTGKDVLCLNHAWLGSARFSPNGKWFAFKDGMPKSDSLALKVFESATGQVALRFEQHQPKDSVGDFCFSPDSRLLAVAGRTEGRLQMQVWDVAAHERQGQFPGDYQALAFSPDGSTLAAATSEVVALLDLATGQTRMVLKGHRELIGALAFSTDGTMLTAYTVRGRGRMGTTIDPATTWDLGSGKLLNRIESASGFEFQDPNEGETARLLVQHDAHGWSVCDVMTGTQVGTWPSRFDPVRISSDGQTLVTNEQDRRPSNKYQQWLDEQLPGLADWADRRRQVLRLWDLRTHDQLHTLRGYYGECRFSPDGRTFVVQKDIDDSTIEVFDVPPSRALGRIAVLSMLPAAVVLLVGWRQPKKSGSRKE
jgi:WD40 repeat protein